MFQNTDLKQLTLSVFAFNPRAQRVYEKTGFVLESVEEGALEDDGKLIDSYNMVLTRERWEKLREAGGGDRTGIPKRYILMSHVPIPPLHGLSQQKLLSQAWILPLTG